MRKFHPGLLYVALFLVVLAAIPLARAAGHNGSARPQYVEWQTVHSSRM